MTKDAVYVLDTSSFRVLGNYYPDTFPTFWAQLDELVQAERFVSVSESRKEIAIQDASAHLASWVDQHSNIFRTPTSREMTAVARIFAISHFQQLIGQKQRLRGYPVADPFVIARAMVDGACVVTEEALKPNAAKIPNVCQHFQVACLNMQGLLKQEGWRF
jgi:Domain of unknown function (DUF4411)